MAENHGSGDECGSRSLPRTADDPNDDDPLDLHAERRRCGPVRCSIVEDDATTGDEMRKVRSGEEGRKLDYETKRTSYMVTVTAEDSFGERHHHGDHHGHRQWTKRRR